MLFAIICTDRPDSLELRMATRAQHLAFLELNKAAIQFGGPQLGADGKPCGSLILLEAEDRASAEALPQLTPTPRWTCLRA